MLKLNEVNPLAVFGLRQLDHCPPHFTIIKFEIFTHDKVITNWIWENLEGRFYFGEDYLSIKKPDRGFALDSFAYLYTKLIGFEIASEASYFSLLLSTINKNDW